MSKVPTATWPAPGGSPCSRAALAARTGPPAAPRMAGSDPRCRAHSDPASSRFPPPLPELPAELHDLRRARREGDGSRAAEKSPYPCHNNLLFKYIIKKEFFLRINFSSWTKCFFLFISNLTYLPIFSLHIPPSPLPLFSIILCHTSPQSMQVSYKCKKTTTGIFKKKTKETIAGSFQRYNTHHDIHTYKEEH